MRGKTTYLDTSFFIKLYVFEPESPLAVSQMQDISAPLVNDLTDVDVASTLYRKLPQTQANPSNADYIDDFDKARFESCRVRTYCEEAATLARQGSGPLQLRSQDRLHPATALFYGASAVATFDKRLCAAAEFCGLSVIGARL